MRASLRPPRTFLTLVLACSALFLVHGALAAQADPGQMSLAPARRTAAVATPVPSANVATARLDGQLRWVLRRAGVQPLDPGPEPEPAKVELGQLLFFDKELSGNRDTSCATCHHPSAATGDGLSLSVGTGGLGQVPDRQRGAMRPLVPRNAPELFNRGASDWHTMFWDSRITGTPLTGLSVPEEFREDLAQLPAGLDNVLAAQALFPVTSRVEMRGARRDVDVFGRDNELAAIDDRDLEALWEVLMARLLALPEYRELFAAVYPEVPTDELGFQHAANAIAAFEIDAFTLLNSPWDRYLAGDNRALSEDAKRGALLFYGKANCAACHNGSLLTDQLPHNIGVSQLGPGKGRETPYQDLGRYRESGDRQDRYAFRTPPLRNVALTGPWMHNGAYTTLEAAVRHHLDPAVALQEYALDGQPGRSLAPDVRSESEWDGEAARAVLETLDPLAGPVQLTDAEVNQLLAFLDALTDPAALDLDHTIPDAVPSGLPVSDELDASAASSPEPAAFDNVTAEAGITAMHRKGYQVTGQAWGDYDSDGWLDLYLTDSLGANYLYRNLGDGTFVLSPLADQVALPEHYSGGATFADYDNDGWQDLYVLAHGPNVLFRNLGGQGFVDVTTTAGVGDDGGSKSAAWGDYDNDSDLDLYVANWSCSPRCPRPAIGDRDTLYRNNGDGTFTDVTAVLGIHEPWGAGFVAAFTDYDNDGDVDIYLVNDEFINPIGNKLWRNDGPGCGEWCFTEVATQLGAAETVMGMGLAVDDFNQDGLFDFYFSNAGETVLLQNRGQAGFANVAPAAGAGHDKSVVGWGAVSLDYDNDGDRDLYQNLMKTSTDVSPFNSLLRNNGDGTFANLGRTSGAGDPGPSVGLAAADYDNDGWVDLVVGNYDRSYQLYRNLGAANSSNHWLALKLVGGGPVNRDAVGTRVVVTTQDGRRQVQEVRSGGSGLGGGSALDLHFGLGQGSLQSVEVHWPDNTSMTFYDLAPDRRYQVNHDGAVTAR